MPGGARGNGGVRCVVEQSELKDLAKPVSMTPSGTPSEVGSRENVVRQPQVYAFSHVVLHDLPNLKPARLTPSNTRGCDPHAFGPVQESEP